MQEVFTAWAAAVPAEENLPTVLDHGRLGFVMGRFRTLREQPDDARLTEQIHESTRVLERVAVAILRRALPALGIAAREEGLNPYAATGDPATWADNGLWTERHRISPDPEIERELGTWLTP
jgi:hypothetical protein